MGPYCSTLFRTHTTAMPDPALEKKPNNQQSSGNACWWRNPSHTTGSFGEGCFSPGPFQDFIIVPSTWHSHVQGRRPLTTFQKTPPRTPRLGSEQRSHPAHDGGQESAGVLPCSSVLHRVCQLGLMRAGARKKHGEGTEGMQAPCSLRTLKQGAASLGREETPILPLHALSTTWHSV